MDIALAIFYLESLYYDQKHLEHHLGSSTVQFFLRNRSIFSSTSVNSILSNCDICLDSDFFLKVKQPWYVELKDLGWFWGLALQCTGSGICDILLEDGDVVTKFDVHETNCVDKEKLDDVPNLELPKKGRLGGCTTRGKIKLWSI